MNRSDQARLLYTLLDAAEDENRLVDSSMAERWRSIKSQFDNAHCEKHMVALKELFDELDSKGALVGTWIQARWYAVRARPDNSPYLRIAPTRTKGRRPFSR